MNNIARVLKILQRTKKPVKTNRDKIETEHKRSLNLGRDKTHQLIRSRIWIVFIT